MPAMKKKMLRGVATVINEKDFCAGFIHKIILSPRCYD